MNNLYKVIKIDNILYSIIQEMNNGITCISNNNNIKRFNFANDDKLNEFVKNHLYERI